MMDVEGIVLGERNQTDRGKHYLCIVSLTGGIKKKSQIHRKKVKKKNSHQGQRQIERGC